VKNIALAIQMYLADNNDTLPDVEHRQEVIEYFNTSPGGGSWNEEQLPMCNRTRQANPYLRWPVILDEYVKNRDVWRCPSAKVESGATWIVPGPDWFTYLVAHEGEWGQVNWRGPCSVAWPPGWGGTITDSILQDRLAVGPPGEGVEMVHKSFSQSIGCATVWDGHETKALKMVEVQDPANSAIVADAGVIVDDLTGLGAAAYPDICNVDCANCACSAWREECWDNIMAGCGECAVMHARPSHLADPTLLKPYTRHLGGVNLGFLDGHAQWMLSEALINKVKEGELMPFSSWGPTSDCSSSETGGLPFSEAFPDEPTIY
jgi:prepilin-type processing-associated H-X9-DG protein